MVYRFNIRLPDGHILLLGFTSRPSWESLWDEFIKDLTELPISPKGHLTYHVGPGKWIINSEFSLGVMLDSSPGRLIWDLHLNKIMLTQPSTRAMLGMCL
jgi:hypothetical protein